MLIPVICSDLIKNLFNEQNSLLFPKIMVSQDVLGVDFFLRISGEVKRRFRNKMVFVIVHNQRLRSKYFITKYIKIYITYRLLLKKCT